MCKHTNCKSLQQTAPHLMSVILDGGMTAKQLRPNKEFLANSSPTKAEKAEALLFTAAKRHCDNEAYEGFGALNTLVIKSVQEKLDADPKCASEWATLIKSALIWLHASSESCFADANPNLLAAILDSGMTNKQLLSKANKELLQVSSSPTKVELAEAVIKTAVRRHCGNAKYEGMGALTGLVISSASKNLEEYEGCTAEWARLVEQASSPDGIDGIFELGEAGSAKKALRFEEADEEPEADAKDKAADSAEWPAIGMKLKALQAMAAGRGIAADDVDGNRGHKKTWIKAIVGSFSLKELKGMAAAMGLDEEEIEGHKGHKKPWADAILDAAV